LICFYCEQPLIDCLPFSMSTSAAASTVPIPMGKPVQIPSKMKNPHTGAWIPLSSTPGGSIFGTTPGGTRIQYDRASLLSYRNSPLSKSPALLPQSIINLGVTTDAAQPIQEERRKDTAATNDSSHAASTSSNAQSSKRRTDEEDLEEDMFELEQ